jgi:hypothetical protein
MRSIWLGGTGAALLALACAASADEASAVAAVKKLGATILCEDNDPKKRSGRCTSPARR